MATPAADDLLMICWDTEKGAPAGWTGMSLPYALAGAATQLHMPRWR